MQSSGDSQTKNGGRTRKCILTYCLLALAAQVLIFFSLSLWRSSAVASTLLGRIGSAANHPDSYQEPLSIKQLAAAEALAEFTYTNQQLERGKEPSAVLGRFGANWPCLWGAEATGQLTTYKTHWDKYRDGWKFTCGLRLLQKPCVVYSLGSSGNMDFEAAVLAAAPFCELHIFDRDSFDLAQWFPDASARKHQVFFHRMFITGVDDRSQDPPRRSLASICAELGHTHLDVLKMDIEGAEFDLFGPGKTLPVSVGQLQLEIHTGPAGGGGGRTLADVSGVVAHLERCGLRLFHKEVNALYNVHCAELAFIQKHWLPTGKSYATC